MLVTIVANWVIVLASLVMMVVAKCRKPKKYEVKVNGKPTKGAMTK